MMLNRCILTLAVCCLLAAPLLANRPNILLIVSEDNGPELGCYGDALCQDS
jgi:N-sulfoglucosamine sulfohydrolase